MTSTGTIKKDEVHEYPLDYAYDKSHQPASMVWDHTHIKLVRYGVHPLVQKNFKAKILWEIMIND